MYTVIIEDPIGVWARTSVSELKYTHAFRKAWQLYKKIPYEVVLEREADRRIKDLNAEKLKGPRR